MLCYRPKNRKTIASPFPSSLFSLLSFHGSFRMVSNLVFIRWQNLFQLRSLQNRHKHPQFGFIEAIRTRSAFLVVTLLIFRSLLLLLLNFLLFGYERPLIKERFPSPQINRSAQSVHFPRITVTIKLLSALSFLSLHWNCGANWTRTSGILGCCCVQWYTLPLLRQANGMAHSRCWWTGFPSDFLCVPVIYATTTIVHYSLYSYAL